MRFTSFILTPAVAAISIASPVDCTKLTVPGYPRGNGICLTDDQAMFVANTFKSILSNTDRSAANVTAQAFIAEGYTETSDSVNIQAGYPLGSTTFANKTAFIGGAVGQPALNFTTLKVFHDCTNVLWHWNVAPFFKQIYPVKGFNSIVANPATGQAVSNTLEFNSIAWSVDIGGTWVNSPYAPH